MIEWAKKELALLGKDEEGWQDAINADILQIVEIFGEQGHSGFSASYALSIIKRLLDWKPITPLTGEESEWEECGPNLEQNNRCSAVFRDNHDNATAHYIYGKVFSDDGGKSWFNSRGSHTPVTFPFVVPEFSERVIIDKEEDAK
jgi:hypothetical protein